ncbi:zeta toxin family protein [Rhodococcus sp. IEGM 1379]|uniref:zeta toxin family protein n=1 Tax=Rhodococcus sp. IEGM 1379 TaxID=3047086 RepID=UPI0024B708FF|nr:zeta toxin family protein [Rhodococcus sp. IEGM 1379]MDI9918472.1 zeta toxin family protein [Rhodococcus sp. IEGM 1379]
MKRLDLVVGCNGAGKSTFVALTLAPLLPGSPFVYTDEIAKQRWPANPATHSYEAAAIAAKTRSHLLALGKSFIAETVFSHPSKLELIDEARSHEYTVVLHVVMIPEELAVQRVRYRVRAGGHDVPEDKIRQRYQRLWGLAARAFPRCDHATVYDNSSSTGPRIVAQFTDGYLVGEATWPAWTPAELTSCTSRGERL